MTSNSIPGRNRRQEILDKLALFLAQGLGIGRMPFAPGTWGSGLGFIWFLLLIAPGNAPLFFTAILLSSLISVLCAESAEKTLRQHDPGSVVIDEIIAVPICFLGWLYHLGDLPHPAFFLQHWKTTLVILFLWRLFNVWKPWPVRGSQKLPGGWGVTVDDILAGIYVALITGIWFAWKSH